MIAEQAAPALLNSWDNFYVIVGSSAGALTGLQFVVMALVAEENRASMAEVRAFGSPTVVHFCTALLIAAIVCAPWRTLGGVVVALAVCGVLGVLYALRVIVHARRQTGYQPDAEDILWYVASPLIGQALLLTGAMMISFRPHDGLFVVALDSLLFLFLGVRNSWDTVTYIAIGRAHKREE